MYAWSPCYHNYIKMATSDFLTGCSVVTISWFQSGPAWVASWCKPIWSNQMLQSVVVSEEIIFQYHNNYTAHNHCPVLQIAWLPLCSYGNQVVPTKHP